MARITYANYRDRVENEEREHKYSSYRDRVERN